MRTDRKNPTNTPNDFDAAAARAARELPGCRTLADVAGWWKTHYLTAGHKRLGRLLVAQAK